MNGRDRVLLVFPPIVTTNFGRYYPSIAALASVLEADGVGVDQLDLNNDLLEYCIGGERLADLVAAGEQDLERGQPMEPWRRQQILAAKAASRRSCFYDEAGRLLPAGHHGAPVAILEALSADYYLDPSLDDLCSPDLWDRPQIIAARDFIRGHERLETLLADASVIGVSVPMGPQLAHGLALAREAAQHNIPVVIGGATVTLLGRDNIAALLRSHPWISAVVPHQGEEPFGRLVDEVLRRGRKTDWHEIPGILSLAGDTLHGTAGQIPSRRLADLPFGSYDLGQLRRLAEPEVAIRQAEGCYWGKCAYCDYVELYPKTGRNYYRPQAQTSLVNEIEHHVRTSGVRRFVLITESVPPLVARRLSEEIIARGLHVKWSSFAMVDPGFDAQTLATMAAGGCSHLVIGVETVTDRVLSLVRKRATRSMTERFFADCRTAGIPLVINLIPNLPSTTHAEALESLAVIEKYLECFRDISIFPFEATVSSDIGRDPAQFGLTVLGGGCGESSGQAEFAANHLTTEDTAMTPSELEDVIARHYDLAARAGSTQHLADPARTDPRTATRWLVDSRHIDLYPAVAQDRGSLVFNWRTGVVSEYPVAWNAILSQLQEPDGVDGPSVTQTVASEFGLDSIEAEAVSSYVLNHLGSRGVLRASHMDGRGPAG